MAGTPTDAPQPERGVVFPAVDGRRSTTATGRAVFADAARVADPATATAIENERDWRSKYVDHIRTLVSVQARRPDLAVDVARAGLARIRRSFRYVRDGEEHEIADALDLAPGRDLETVTVVGHGGDDPTGQLVVPYHGDALHGESLVRQLDRWCDHGLVEPSFAAAVRDVVAHPDWLDLSGERFVVVGAGAEMGPMTALSRWGAEVYAVDVPSPRVWRRILDTAVAGRGRVHVPVRSPVADPADLDAVSQVAGIDAVEELPELASWIRDIPGPVTLGNYVYADGAGFVTATVAVDTLAERLCRDRDDVRLAVLATPTDMYAVPEDVVTEARRRYDERPLLRRGLGGLPAISLFVPAYRNTVTTDDGRTLGIADSMVVQQGPNYALAKRIQQWRAMVARDEGHLSSVNVAPATRTRSVTKNRVLAAAYAGAHRYDVEVFEPDTSNTLMAAMLVHDLRGDRSTAHPSADLDHPLALYWRGAAHGGLWRQPYAPRSVLPLAAVRGWRALLR